jgi:hypothetical protein
MGVHLMSMYLMDVHLMGVHLMGVHLMCAYLVGVHLTGRALYLIAEISNCRSYHPPAIYQSKVSTPRHPGKPGRCS